VIAVVGDKEAAAGLVAPRWRGKGNQPAIALDEFVEQVRAESGFPTAAHGAGSARAA
jgi:threonyl-tRNA synthetase